MAATRKKTSVVLGLMVLALLCLTLEGCGIKSPPLPPVQKGNAVAVPDHMAFTRNGSRVTLTWNHTVDPVNAQIPAEGFKVLLAFKGPDACEGCPFKFEPVGTVAMPDKTFEYTLKETGRYYFKVRAVGPDDLESPDSKVLFVELQE